ncbi:MAG: ribonuclease R [Lachnospiraceae bacterium]|nr:ribonuclease R [Lachnospiraceae bacterium]
MSKEETKKQYEGTFISNQRGFGFVEVEGMEEDFFIPEDYVGPAFHQDQVKIQVIEGREGKRTEAMIIEILSHEITTVVGTYQKSGNFGFIIPDDKKITRDIFIPQGKDLHALHNQKVVCYLTGYGDLRHKPEGIIVEILGFPSDPGVDVTSIVRTFGIPTAFPENVMAEAEEKNEPVSKKDIKGRLDLRDEVMVTIDGDDSKDLDDAVSLKRDGDNYILGVHIADVSNYVTDKSDLDAEARHRGTSVYLVDRVIPMLPTSLSNGICSLNEDEDRLTLSCIMTIDPKGKVVDYKICESVIHSTRRMTYTNVNRILEDEDPEVIKEYEEIVPMFREMANLAKILNKRRTKRGSIDFDFPETVIILDEKGRPTEIRPYERRTSNRLIEEFMLLANETVARYACEENLPFLFRVHGTPDGEKITNLSHFIGNFGYSLKGDKTDISPKEIQRLLNNIKDTPEEDMLARLTLRSMQQAKYDVECDGHFGLAAEYYCHFTSPIRRYPDLMIHRILKEHWHGKLKKRRSAYYEGSLPQIAVETSKLERRADETEREVDKLKKVQFISSYIDQEFLGVISGITKWGVYVELSNTVEGMIPIVSLDDDYYEFDEEHYCLVGERTKRTFTLGEPLRIRVVKTDFDTRTIDFELAERKKDKGGKKSFVKSRKGKPLKKKAAIKEKDRKRSSVSKAAKKHGKKSAVKSGKKAGSRRKKSGTKKGNKK